jgi:hypothetical protein
LEPSLSLPIDFSGVSLYESPMMHIDLPVSLTQAIDGSIAFVYSLEKYVAPTVVLGENHTLDKGEINY